MELRARVTTGEEFRSSSPVSEEKVDKIHAALSKVVVTFPRGNTTTHLRELMRTIHAKRDLLRPILGFLYRAQGSLEADLRRIERLTEAERAIRQDSGDIFVQTTNDKQREARMKIFLSPLLDASAVVEQDVSRVKGALSHARLVLEELRGAFDDASRLLASVELDWRITRGDT